MKSQKGITLTSVIIYIMGMTMCIGVIATLTTYFYKNMDTIDDYNYTTEYTRFISLITDEINQEGNTIIETKTYTENQKQISYIIFSSGNQYTYTEENHCIYMNNVKICKGVDICKFGYVEENGKYKVNVEIKIGNINQTEDNKLIFTIK